MTAVPWAGKSLGGRGVLQTYQTSQTSNYFCLTDLVVTNRHVCKGAGMAIHSLRVLKTKKRRTCTSCGESIKAGVSYFARNSSLSDERGNPVYGFFSTHLDCEWLVGELSVGLGSTEAGMSFPGWLPSRLSGMKEVELEGLDGWGKLSEESRKRFTALRRRRKVHVEPRLEYRYYDPYTKERTGFTSTLTGMREVVGNV